MRRLRIRLRRALYRWQHVETRTFLNGEPWVAPLGGFEIATRLNGPTTITPPVDGLLEIVTVGESSLLGYWRRRRTASTAAFAFTSSVDPDPPEVTQTGRDTTNEAR